MNRSRASAANEKGEIEMNEKPKAPAEGETMITIETLNQFCDANDFREYLRKPWVYDGRTFATDGRIGVIAEGCIEGAVGAIEQSPDLNAVILATAKKLDGIEAGPMPMFPSPDKCHRCVGGTVKLHQCTTCDGEGAFEHDGEEYDCKSCHTTGQVSAHDANAGQQEACRECNGTGATQTKFEIGCTAFDLRYLILIATLPNVRIAIHPTDECACAVFHFDGGMGVVMPMRK